MRLDQIGLAAEPSPGEAEATNANRQDQRQRGTFLECDGIRLSTIDLFGRGFVLLTGLRTKGNGERFARGHRAAVPVPRAAAMSATAGRKRYCRVYVPVIVPVISNI
jgi:hypothetical protein